MNLPWWTHFGYYRTIFLQCTSFTKPFFVQLWQPLLYTYNTCGTGNHAKVTYIIWYWAVKSLWQFMNFNFTESGIALMNTFCLMSRSCSQSNNTQAVLFSNLVTDQILWLCNVTWIREILRKGFKANWRNDQFHNNVVM